MGEVRGAHVFGGGGFQAGIVTKHHANNQLWRISAQGQLARLSRRTCLSRRACLSRFTSYAPLSRRAPLSRFASPARQDAWHRGWMGVVSIARSPR